MIYQGEPKKFFPFVMRKYIKCFELKFVKQQDVVYLSDLYRTRLVNFDKQYLPPELYFYLVLEELFLSGSERCFLSIPNYYSHCSSMLTQ